MTHPNRYRLSIDLIITREEGQNVGTEQEYWRPTQENLRISESLPLGSLDFMGVMKVLGQLHDAVTAISDTNKATNQGTQS